MTARGRENVYWISNKDWYYIDYEADQFVLRFDAPERARRSFKQWLKNWPKRVMGRIEEAPPLKQTA
jgi:hypothetical protein